jgi:hypothetical protein
MEDNNNPKNAGKPGSWYVKWATLHYIDLDGEEQEIDMIPDCMNIKNPDDGDDAYEFTGDDSEDEDEEHICHTCSEKMNDEDFQKGKMCCDKPMFHNDEDDSE